MDKVLNSYLPIELGDIVARMVWDMNIKEVHRQLKYNIVWIRSDDEFSFLVSNNVNSYAYLCLKYDDLTEIRSNKYIEFMGWY